ncbi:MAG: cyclic pyranopterin phosphate synthase [Halieaceae bacterium]|jgi:cyclic pyranopterin phosphate synthase
MNTPTALVDRFGREVNYVRLSVTDRCDFRCVYCMAEEMTFLPRRQVLSLEELFAVGQAFVGLGVRKIRITGGEPLIRRNILSLLQRLGALPGLDELVLTTNGSQLVTMAQPLRDAGVKRLNISIDSLRSDRFKRITRSGDLAKVLAGIEAARRVGFDGIKLNAVILKGRNHDEILDLVDYARDNDLDLSFIEEMPLGLIDDHDRALSHCSSEEIADIISTRYPLTSPGADDNAGTTSGPARYHRMADSNSRIGFISPHSHNFCHLCNRVRVTAEGRLLLCLGNEHSADLKTILREDPAEPATAGYLLDNQDELRKAIVTAMDLKPERHHFDLDGAPEIVRFMNMTGG